jgi:hypothetical protein
LKALVAINEITGSVTMKDLKKAHGLHRLTRILAAKGREELIKRFWKSRNLFSKRFLVAEGRKKGAGTEARPYI